MKNFQKGFALIPLLIILVLAVAAGYFVLNKQNKTGTGILEGKVSIGPVCPVERLDQPCDVSAETYTSREVIITKFDKSVYGYQHLEADGSYRFVVSSGLYMLEIGKLGIDRAVGLPKSIEIKAGQTTTVNFSIDTGVR